MATSLPRVKVSSAYAASNNFPPALKASVKNGHRLQQVISQYCQASGQYINLEKFAIYFSPNTPTALQDKISVFLKIPKEKNPRNCLGLPTLWGRSKCEALAFLRDRIIKRLQGWKEALLSYSGKEVLLKSVVSGLPSYAMACFKFPKKWCHNTHSLMAKFLWEGKSSESSIHWKSWEDLTMPKEKRGMGFKDLEAMNIGLLSKLAWRIILNPKSFLAQILEGIYFPDGNLWNAKKGPNSSWGWASIVEGRDFLKSNVRWQVHDGKSISIWNDAWIPNIRSFKLQPSIDIPLEVRGMTVGNLIDPCTHTWNLDKISDLISQKEKQAILQIPISLFPGIDKLIWPYEKTGNVTVKSAYKIQKGLISNTSSTSTSHQIDPGIWNLIWKTKCLPKVQNFMWIACQNAVAVRMNLAKKGTKINNSCPFCSYAETVEHMLLQCEWTHLVWFACLDYKPQNSEIQTFDQWFIEVCHSIKHAQEEKKMVRSLIAYTCWFIWLARNDAVLQKKNISPEAVICRIQRTVADFYQAHQQMGRKNYNIHTAAGSDQWSKPVRGRMKLNVAVCSGKTTGMAYLVRDWQGNSMGNQAKVEAEGYKEVAVAKTIRTGLQDMLKLGHTAIEIEYSDKKAKASLKDKGDWKLGTLMYDIKVLKRFFSYCSIKEISDKTNMCAFRIAKWAKEQKRKNWTTCPSYVYAPQCLLDVQFEPP